MTAVNRFYPGYPIIIPESMCKAFYIPSQRLILTGNGKAERTERKVISEKASRIMEQYLNECNAKNTDFDQSKLDNLTERANTESTIMIGIPDDLLSLLDEKERIQKSMNLINTQIAACASKILTP